MAAVIIILTKSVLVFKLGNFTNKPRYVIQKAHSRFLCLATAQWQSCQFT